MATGDRAPLVGVLLAAGGLAVVAVWQAVTPPPWWFLTREDLPACPRVVVHQGAAPPATDACLFGEDADRRGAELEVEEPTTEGDPIRTYYRRVPGSPGLEVVVDTSDDHYGGGQGWERLDCPAAVSLAHLGDCRPVP